ncbi:hypothetical protein [Desulfocucumis palustris]|uniref:hypothetical protein n=1 Tax=Desulfocucumis palustris TaxID=1898651 RepID=UPI000CEA187A|nr:hypothetical protein [Desulfocucumis palustris]
MNRVPDYKEMYEILFSETTKVISALQKAQQRTEEMYIADDTADNLIVISPDNDNDKIDENKHPPQE